MTVVVAVGSVAVLLVSAQPLGAYAMRGASFSSNAERLAVVTALGLGAVGALLFLLGLLGGLQPSLILSCAAALCGTWLVGLHRIDFRATITRWRARQY